MRLPEYKKGLPNDELRSRIYEQIERPDVFEVSNLIDAMDPERDPVDICIYLTKSSDIHIIRKEKIKRFDIDEEVDFVYELSQRRDEPLASITDLPEHFTKVSYFLQDTIIKPYKEGQDFVDNQADFDSIQNGDLPKKEAKTERETNILTGRHAATYVHADDPIKQGTDALKSLLSLKCPKRRGLPDLSRQEDFTCLGYPFIAGMLGEGLRRCGLLSFRLKWRFRVARPEEYYYEKTGGFLPQAFPEGSPTHPAHPAMHGAAAYTTKYILLEMFDNNFIMPTGNTLEYELDLMAGNIAQWRSWAGVHYPSDNIAFDAYAKQLAKAIVKEYVL